MQGCGFAVLGVPLDEEGVRCLEGDVLPVDQVQLERLAVAVFGNACLDRGDRVVAVALPVPLLDVAILGTEVVGDLSDAVRG